MFFRHGKPTLSLTASSGVILILLVVASLISCSNAGTGGERQASVTIAVPASGPPPAPSTCRFVGTVVAIDSSFSGVDQNDPCNDTPCHASVRVDSIIAYGAAFPGALSTGQTIRVRFRYTLNSAEKFFPLMKPVLPGVTLGTRFQAVLEAEPDQASSTWSEFVVGSYAVQ